MMRIALPALLLLGLAVPLAAGAQDAPEPRTSLSLRPFGGTEIGLWHRVSARLELGLQVGAAVSREDGEGGLERERTEFSVEPAAKFFASPRGALQPYGIASVYYQDVRIRFAENQEDHSSAVGASVGLGMEWSPVARVRIGGHAGLRANLLDTDQTGFSGGGPVVQDLDGWGAGTFTSGLVFYYTF